MTIVSAPGLLTALPVTDAASFSIDSEAIEKASELDPPTSFMALLQQAAAVLPQALQVIRNELTDTAVSDGNEAALAAGSVQADALLVQIGATFSSSEILTDEGGDAGLGAARIGMLGSRSSLIAAGDLEASSMSGRLLLDTSTPVDVEVAIPASGLQAASSPLNETSAPPASPQRPIQAAVGSQGWAEEIGARLTMLGARGEQTASLRLSPEHLGPLEVRITIQDDKASVWFGAAHAQTREAIEQALPRLREMLEAQGLTLADAGIFDDSPSREAASQTSSSSKAEAESSDEPPLQLRRRGLLDMYA